MAAKTISHYRIDYIFADPHLKGWIQQNPSAWRLILAHADRVFANASVMIYRHRNSPPVSGRIGHQDIARGR
ncbi:MAG TPA: hypothetical protein VGK70_15215 [Thermoanaerobaculia bacterium]|jgi:hypothetical protein